MRPNTRQGKSRPATSGRPQTAVSVRNNQSSYITALLEGRGVSREVGIAALDRDTGRVLLVQVADCQTYVKTLHQMHLQPPSLILVPDTSLTAADPALATSSHKSTSSSMLMQYVCEEFPGIPLAFVGRKFWNDNAGLEFIIQLCVEDDKRAGTVIAVSNKYYTLSAACALFKYAETQLNACFAAASLCIRYIAVEGTMMVDPDTARNLELMGNIWHKKSAHSLYGTLNHTYTPMASRLLRVNILSPIIDQSAIDARLDAVEEMIKSEDRFVDLRDSLKNLNKMDLDKLIASLASSEARAEDTAKLASQRVMQMLNLRNVVKALPSLKNSLQGCHSQLLRIICEMLSDDRLNEIEQLICSNLNEDSAPSKAGIGAINARVYALKANCNRLLDVARETYKENVGDIFQLNRSLSEDYELPLSLTYQDHGFVFSLKKSDVEGELPKAFVNMSVKKGKYVFSTMELKKMNARMKDALDETLILSNKIIQDLVSKIISSVGALYKASEAVALADMLWSFAHVSIARNYIRPEFTGTLAIKSGKHPILEIVQPAGTLVPNDTYCDDSSSFQIIQGPNMSGKSTYLRQIGLLVIMAMCGCFVPAEYASFRIHDALLTRLSNDDDMEKSLSTFANEMASSAMILGLASPNSLVLVDELGRGTSPNEGVGISHAIAEILIKLKSFTFFATHFQELITTLSRQPNIVKLHLSVQRNRSSVSNFGMTFQYKIIDGASDDHYHYGLELARLADLPAAVLAESWRVAEHLAAIQTSYDGDSNSKKIANRRIALLRLRTQLVQALEYSALPAQDLLAYIQRFQVDIAKAFMPVRPSDS